MSTIQLSNHPTNRYEKIKVVVLKEWAEVFRNKLVLFSVAFLPLVLLALPFIMVIIMNNVPRKKRQSMIFPKRCWARCVAA